MAWALEKSLTSPLFFLYFREIRNKRSHWPGGQSAQKLYNCYNLCPCARHAHVGECWPGPEFKFSKTLQLCQREIFTDEIQEKKNYRECSNIKSARVSALTGSAPGKWPRRGRAFQHSSGIEPRIEGIESMSPDSLPLASTTKPLCHIKCWKKTVYDLSYFATCNRIFCIQDCRSRHNFYSMLIEQLVDLEKVRTDKLKFRTDLRDWVMDGWSVTQ